MNKINPDLVMAIIALIAIISPIITTFLNNKHQLKMLKIEKYEFAKYTAINNFIQSAEEYYYHPTKSQNLINFDSSIANLYMYFSIIDHSIFEKIKEYIKIADLLGCDVFTVSRDKSNEYKNN